MMNKDLISEIKDSLKKLQAELNQIVNKVEAVEASEYKEYLTTTEFAHIIGKAPKTISNYASMGRFESAKFEDGQWLIHKNEIQSCEFREKKHSIC